MDPIVFYIRFNGAQYCEGPLSEMPPDATQVPERPNCCCIWDTIQNEWVFSIETARSDFLPVCDLELKRTEKFFSEDYVIDPQDKQMVIDYRNALRGYIENPTETPPVCPMQATDDYYYNIP